MGNFHTFRKVNVGGFVIELDFMNACYYQLPTNRDSLSSKYVNYGWAMDHPEIKSFAVMQDRHRNFYVIPYSQYSEIRDSLF